MTHSKSQMIMVLVMSKIKLPSETWVELYCELSTYVLEYSSPNTIYMEDENGDTIYTPKKQLEFEKVSDQVEEIMAQFFIKGDL